MMNEADTRAKLIGPKLSARGWNEDHIKRKATTGAITIVARKAWKAPRGRTDYTLRVKLNIVTQSVIVALIETESEALSPTHLLKQAGTLVSRCTSTTSARPSRTATSPPSRSPGRIDLDDTGIPIELMVAPGTRLPQPQRV